MQGVYRSAFGMNGHKCSACSRVYVHRDVADDFLARLVQGGRGRALGDPLDKGVFVGPVATAQSYDDYQRYVGAGPRGRAGVVRAGGDVVNGRRAARTATSCGPPCSPGCRAITS